MRTRKSRRSERTTATYRLVLTILGSGGVEYLKEIITTTEISLYGARIRGRRTLKPGWKGTLGELGSGRKVPIRIVWQAAGSSRSEYKESAVEILSSEYKEPAAEILTNLNFWGQPFSSPDQEPEAIARNAAVCVGEAVEHLQNSPDFRMRSKEEVLSAVWSVLQRQLESGKPAKDVEIAGRLQELGSKKQGAPSPAELVFDLSQSY